MNWYIPKEQLTMYRMKNKPPKMPLNDCIVQYKQTGDERFLQYFLHYYESALNRRTENFCEQYGQLNHFQDIKQTIITTMLLQIGNYDSTVGASLVTFTDKHVAAAVHDYIRSNCGTICASEYDYDNLRNVMAAYYEKPGATETERLEWAVTKTGLNGDVVRYHLHHGDLFRYSESLTGGRCDNEDDGYLQLIERIADIYDNPEYIVLEKMFYEAIVAAVDTLPFKEKHIILGYYGLERYRNRFKEVEPLSKVELAARLHIGKVQSVDDNARRAVALLRTGLEKQDWIEGNHMSKLAESAEKDDIKLTALDREIIDYAVRKWRESGDSAEFHMLFQDERVDGKRFVREFLRLFLY